MNMIIDRKTYEIVEGDKFLQIGDSFWLMKQTKERKEWPLLTRKSVIKLDNELETISYPSGLQDEIIHEVIGDE